MKKRHIPHWVLPGFWGLSGKTLEKAKIEYYYSGYERDVEMAKLEANGDEEKYQIMMLVINKTYGKISEREYKESVINLKHSKNDYVRKSELLKLKFDMTDIDKTTYHKQKLEIDKEFDKISQEDYEISILNVKLDNGEIDKNEYDKQVANIKKEPWVQVIGIEIDYKSPRNGGCFNIDWNEFFIEHLKENGYTGFNDEDIINGWLNDIHRACLSDEIGDIDEDTSNSRNNSRNLGDGRVEYE